MDGGEKGSKAMTNSTIVALDIIDTVTGDLLMTIGSWDISTKENADDFFESQAVYSGMCDSGIRRMTRARYVDSHVHMLSGSELCYALSDAINS